MSEAVRVVVKCRPMNRREKEMQCQQVLEVDPSNGQCSITNAKDRHAPPKIFTFDGAYGADATNEQVYLDIAFSLVEGVTEGYNGTVFAYGQTGGGKTFTMQGVTEPAAQKGLIPRAFDHIFDTVAVAEQTRYLIHASFLEIYNEEVRDLLADDTKARLELHERPDSQVFVKDLSMHPVANVRTCEQIMLKGWKNRSTGSTMMNAVSSRSHSIFTIHLERCDDPTHGSKIRASKLNLVDLAGSERQSKTGAMGDRLKEATKINLSLSALGNVISALVDGRSVHIPYRDSKLTRLLQDSLGGNTKTLMIACLSPADNNYDETLSTLRYANRAKNIKNKPRINEDPKDALIRQYLEEINRLKAMLNKASSPSRDEIIRPATPEPKIIEKIVHVPDKEEIRCKTQQIAVEYEKKVQKMAAELAEARTSSERTVVEMDRLKAETEAKQRQLYADFSLQAQTERIQLKQQFDAEMDRVQRELESTRRSKDVVQAEMDSMRRQYEAAMFSVENSVPPQQLSAERDRLRSEYEANMKVMRGALEAMKSSRANVETDMQQLKAEYEARLSAGRSAMMVANASTSTALLTIGSDHERRQQNLTDEMKIVSADSFSRLQSDDRASVAPDDSFVQQSAQSTSDVMSNVQLKLVKDSLSKYSASQSAAFPQDTGVDSTNVSEPPESIDADQLHADVATNHETAVSATKAELEDFKKYRDNIAKVVYRIKTEYQEEVCRAEETVPICRFDIEKQEIRTKYERQMDRVKDDLQVLKSHRDIVTLQLTEQKSAWKHYEEERQKIETDVEAGRLERRLAPQLIKAASEQYFNETRRLNGLAAADKQNVRTKVINERFERERQHIQDDLDDEKLTERDAEMQTDQLIRTRTTELNAIIEQADSAVAVTAVRDLDQVTETNENRKSSKTDAQSSRRGSEETGDAVTLRLKSLEDVLIHGGRHISSDTDHCRLIREKLHREKMNAEEKQRRLQEAHKCTKDSVETTVSSALYDVFASAHDEIIAKTTALEQLTSQNISLQREIADIQAEFEFDRIDYLDTIRKQDQTLKWYQSVVDQILPALRRDSNYSDLERVRVQSQWDDLNQSWKLPKFSVDKKLSLPPATVAGRSSTLMMSPSGSSSFASSLDYELRSEERLIDKLNESAKRDPATAYFRSSMRAESATLADRASVLAASRSSSSNYNQSRQSVTPIPPSPTTTLGRLRYV